MYTWNTYVYYLITAIRQLMDQWRVKSLLWGVVAMVTVFASHELRSLLNRAQKEVDVSISGPPFVNTSQH